MSSSRYFDENNPHRPKPERPAKRPPTVSSFGQIFDIGAVGPKGDRKKNRKPYPIIYHLNKGHISKDQAKVVGVTACKIEKAIWKIVTNDRGVFQPKHQRSKGKARLKPLVYFLVGMQLRCRRKGHTQLDQETYGYPDAFRFLEGSFKAGKWKPDGSSIKTCFLWEDLGYGDARYYLPFISMLFDVEDPREYLSFLEVYYGHMVLRPGERGYVINEAAVAVVKRISTALLRKVRRHYPEIPKGEFFSGFCNALFETAEHVFWHSEYNKHGTGS